MIFIIILMLFLLSYLHLWIHWKFFKFQAKQLKFKNFSNKSGISSNEFKKKVLTCWLVDMPSEHNNCREKMLSWEERERGLINDGGDETGTGKEGGWVKLQRMIDSWFPRSTCVAPMLCLCPSTLCTPCLSFEFWLHATQIEPLLLMLFLLSFINF